MIQRNRSYCTIYLCYWERTGLPSSRRGRSDAWQGWYFGGNCIVYRPDLWNKHEFHTLWTTTGDIWWKKETWFAAWDNAILAAARI